MRALLPPRPREGCQREGHCQGDGVMLLTQSRLNFKTHCMQSRLQAQSVRNEFKLAPQPRAAAGRPTGPRFDISRAETQLSSQEADGVMPGWILGLTIMN